MQLFSTLKPLARYLTMLFGVAACLSSCEDLNQLPVPHTLSEVSKALPSHEGGTKVFYGPATPLGRGVAKAWVSTDKQGKPLSVGVSISEQAVESLMNGHNHEPQAFTPRLPKQADKTLYNQILLDLSPMGHPAPGIYDLPYFDLHAYMVKLVQW